MKSFTSLLRGSSSKDTADSSTHTTAGSSTSNAEKVTPTKQNSSSLLRRLSSSSNKDKGSADSADNTPTKSRSSIFKMLSGSKDKSESSVNKPSVSNASTKKLNTSVSKEVLLRNSLKMRNEQGRWAIVQLQLVKSPSNDARYAVVIMSGEELDRVLLECTSYVEETNLAPFAFELAGYGCSMNFCANGEPALHAWIEHLRTWIDECDAYPTDPIYKEALLRQTGEAYDVTFLEKKSLGVSFERSGEWINVKEARPDSGIQVGSILSAINDVPTTLKQYAYVLNTLRDWKAPLKLTFRRSPVMRGFLTRRTFNQKEEWARRYYVLEAGSLNVYLDDTPGAAVITECPLVGLAVGLASVDIVGRDNCLRIIAGPSELIVQAANRNELFEWASALYYGIAITNGGGYIIALERHSVKVGRPKKELIAEAIAKCTKLELMKRGSTLLSAEEMAAIEAEIREGVMEDEERQGLEARDLDLTAMEVGHLLHDLVAKVADRVLVAGPSSETEAASTESVDVSSLLIDEGVLSGGADDREEQADEAVLEAEPLSEVDAAAPEPELEPELETTPVQNAVLEEELTSPAAVVRQDSARSGKARVLPAFQSFKQVSEPAEEEVIKSQAAHSEAESALAVSDEDLRRVFAVCSKADKDGKHYINVMQFSTIWRKATGVKGNLYKEMKIFNSSFDTEGKGYATEGDFISGWRVVGAGANGSQLLSNLLTTLDKQEF